MPRGKKLLLNIAVMVFAAGLGQAADVGNGATSAIEWPHFRFNDRDTGFQKFETALDTKTVQTVGLAWEDVLSTSSRGGVDYSSPAVVNGVVYIGSGDGHLWAYSADGCGQEVCATPLWSSASVAQIIDSPAVANGVVYVGSQTNDSDASGRLDAYAAGGCGGSECEPLWQGDAGSQSILQSSPYVWNGLVFVGARDGRLYAFNAGGCGKALCQPAWTGQTGGTIESSPVVYQKVVYIGSDDGKIYAFRAKGCGRKKCNPLWTGDIGGPAFQSSPAIANDLVYLASQHTLSAFAVGGCEAPTCTAAWQAVDNSNFFGGSSAIAYGRLYQPLEAGIAVYTAKGCGQSLCDKLWTLFGSGAQASIESAPTVANGVVYAGRNTGEVLAWSADSCGRSICGEIWKGMTDDPVVTSSPTVVNGRIYVGGTIGGDQQSTGVIYVFAPQ